jgi:hypothetical protein
VLCADVIGHAGALVAVLAPVAAVEPLLSITEPEAEPAEPDPPSRPPQPTKNITEQSADREMGIRVAKAYRTPQTAREIPGHSAGVVRHVEPRAIEVSRHSRWTERRKERGLDRDAPFSDKLEHHDSGDVFYSRHE